MERGGGRDELKGRKVQHFLSNLFSVCVWTVSGSKHVMMVLHADSRGAADATVALRFCSRDGGVGRREEGSVRPFTP